MTRPLVPVLVLLLSLAAVPVPPAVAATTVTGLVLQIADYVNVSLAEIVAQVLFNGSALDLAPIRFDWLTPNGSLVRQETVPPDAGGVAMSRLNVTVEGLWSVHSMYTGTPALWDNRTFLVRPGTWGPGTVDLARSTWVGRYGVLSVTPRTTVRLPPGAGLGVVGTMIARGTASQGIAFTSSAGAPAPGDWDSLFFEARSGASSRLENATVSYATWGVRVSGATPVLANVTLRDNVGGMSVNLSRLVLTDARFERNAVALTAFGFSGDLRNVTFAGNPTGLRLSESAGARLERLSIDGAANGAVSGDGGTFRLVNSVIRNSTVGVRQSGGTAVIDRLTVFGGTNALQAQGPGRIEAWNSTLMDLTGLHGSTIVGGGIVFVNSLLMPSERLFVDATSRIEFRNFLRVRVFDHDRNASLPGAAVQILHDSRQVAALSTDANGTTPAVLITDRVLAPAVQRNTTRIVVQGGGLVFSLNNRTVNMATSHVEIFRGSTRDNDRDGEPDFSDPDDDNDGLSDSAEATLGTDPFRPDTDGDGLPDGWEFAHQLLPRDPTDAGADPDADGLPNLPEYGNGTNPRDADTDKDRMPDGWEVVFRLNPLNASDASQDPDGDGFSNIEEYRGGTNPQDPASQPRVPFDAGNSWVWYLLAIVLATGIIALSLLLQKRRRGGPRSPAPKDEED